ncbi:General secretory system II protein E [Archangium gephyra]|uniref:General secretory system II protein E n=1 Tax=Archangium gephyra TaxID=48 RepID=A0AAC8TI15_9BACT|nr:General secretory system II protein E [Archangium gephyra]
MASHLELMDWRQSETADAGQGSEAASPWGRRAIEVDFSSQEALPTDAGVSEGEGEIPLASVHEFIPTWDPSAEPPPAEPEASAQPEGFTGWEADGTGAPEAAPAGASERIQLVQFQESLEALRQATTRGELGKVLLDYCQGRFPRGFLLGETFGYARVGRAYGPGSDKHEVSALQVDLEAPSLLAMAAAGGRAVVSSVPESPVDEQLFAALGESFSHLMAAPIRLNQRTVGFVVLDSGPSPFGAEELDELEQLLSAASETYGRLHDASS